MAERRAISGRNPDVGFLHCGGQVRTPNISTHTGMGHDVDAGALRVALDELGRRASLLVSRLRLRRHLWPGAHHTWEPAAGSERRIPLRIVDAPRAAGHDPAAVFCAEGANRTIDPEREPPFQVELLRRPGGPCDLVTTLHHALYDGASCGFVFFAVKRLYAAALSGADPSRVSLPHVTDPGQWSFVRRQIEASGRGAGRARLLALAARGWASLLRESRFRTVPVPQRDTSDRYRSLHRTLHMDLDDPGLAGLGHLLAARDGTLNELLQAAVTRAFFPWGRAIGLLDRTLPVATTFNLRVPGPDEYPLGNFETAICIELTPTDLDSASGHLDRMIARSKKLKASDLPLGHYLALAGLAAAPSSWLDAIVAKVANCGLLLYSYLGTDFSRRYLGHFGGGEDAERTERLVRDHPGSGAGYVSSFPPMGLVLTVKRIHRRLALNFSLHDGIAPSRDLDRLVASVREEVVGYARMAP